MPFYESMHARSVIVSLLMQQLAVNFSQRRITILIYLFNNKMASNRETVARVLLEFKRRGGKNVVHHDRFSLLVFINCHNIIMHCQGGARAQK